MSDTPRADSNAENISVDRDSGLLIWNTPNGTHVPVEFARELERENAQLRAEISRMQIAGGYAVQKIPSALENELRAEIDRLKKGAT